MPTTLLGMCPCSQVCNHFFVRHSFCDPVFPPSSLCVPPALSAVRPGLGSRSVSPLALIGWQPLPGGSRCQSRPPPPPPTSRPGPERALSLLGAQSPAQDRSEAAKASGHRLAAHQASEQGLAVAGLPAPRRSSRGGAGGLPATRPQGTWCPSAERAPELWPHSPGASRRRCGLGEPGARSAPELGDGAESLAAKPQAG